MIADERGVKMPCESCAMQFSVFKRKRVCCECERYYCSGCLRRGGGAMCAPCRVLSTRPLSRNTIAHLKVRDLQCFLQRQNISTRGCVEKDELVSLCVSHVNSAAYRRRGGRPTGAFSSLKGFTNNINDFLNSAFDLRTSHTPPSSGQSDNCFNSSHAQRPADAGAASRATPHERFTTTPGGEREIVVPPPTTAATDSTSSGSERVDTADCFEIEDLDDAGWEFVTRPADPLPNDSDILLTTDGAPRRQRAPAPARYSAASAHSDFERLSDSSRRPAVSREHLSPGQSNNNLSPGLQRARASSELELRSGTDTTDTASLQDEPLPRAPTPDRAPTDSTPHDSTPVSSIPLDSTPPATDAVSDHPKAVTLEGLPSEADLERLSVKQLKELLARNRVEFRGCLERAELLERARLLWRDHDKYRELDNLPIEECCKICMAAPLECVLLECGHIAACTACATRLAECPICRRYVVRAVRFFRS